MNQSDVCYRITSYNVCYTKLLREEDQILINLDSESKEFKEYTIDLSKLPNLEPMLKRIRIEPAIGVDKGNWEIEYISIQ